MKRFICSMLIFVILTTTMPILEIKTALLSTSIAVEEEKTSIDLTGLQTGKDANHMHIYEKRYDEYNHWEECWICGNKINIMAHNLEVSGTNSCSPGLRLSNTVLYKWMWI